MMKKINPTKKQKNNHARAKRRIKVLLMKNFCKRVRNKRESVASKLLKQKGKTIVGEAAKQIPFVTRYQRSYYIRFKRLNQKQKRKVWRQSPHMRKRA